MQQSCILGEGNCFFPLNEEEEEEEEEGENRSQLQCNLPQQCIRVLLVFPFDEQGGGEQAAGGGGG